MPGFCWHDMKVSVICCSSREWPPESIRHAVLADLNTNSSWSQDTFEDWESRILGPMDLFQKKFEWWACQKNLFHFFFNTTSAGSYGRHRFSKKREVRGRGGCWKQDAINGHQNQMRRLDTASWKLQRKVCLRQATTAIEIEPQEPQELDVESL